MDPKRKRIYIIIMVVCILLSAGLLLYNGSGQSGNQVYTPPVLPIAGTDGSNSKSPAGSMSGNTSGDSKNGYSVPTVFPLNTTFDLSVLTSSSFKQLKKYDAIELDPKLLGRDDPFKNY